MYSFFILGWWKIRKSGKRRKNGNYELTLETDSCPWLKNLNSLPQKDWTWILGNGVILCDRTYCVFDAPCCIYLPPCGGFCPTRWVTTGDSVHRSQVTAHCKDRQNVGDQVLPSQVSLRVGWGRLTTGSGPPANTLHPLTSWGYRGKHGNNWEHYNFWYGPKPPPPPPLPRQDLFISEILMNLPITSIFTELIQLTFTCLLGSWHLNLGLTEF